MSRYTPPNIVSRVASDAIEEAKRVLYASILRANKCADQISRDAKTRDAGVIYKTTRTEILDARDAAQRIINNA